MPDEHTGSEQFTDDDRQYSGSRFRDVVDALFANPYQTVWGREGEPPLPEREQTIRSVFGGLLARGRASRFEGASARTLDSGADLRWGPDRKGFARFLHPSRRLPRGSLAGDRGHAVFGLFRSRQYGARGCPVLEWRRRRPARTDSIAGAGRQVVSDDGPRPPRAATNRELHHAAGHRWGAKRFDQRRRTAERARRDRLPPRPRWHAADQGGVRVPTRRCRAHHPSALSDCGTGETSGRGNTGTGLHAPARRARAARDRRRGPRRARRSHGPDLRPRRSGAEANPDVHDRRHRRWGHIGHAVPRAPHIPELAADRDAWCSTTPSCRTTATP